MLILVTKIYHSITPKKILIIFFSSSNKTPDSWIYTAFKFLPSLLNFALWTPLSPKSLNFYPHFCLFCPSIVVSCSCVLCFLCFQIFRVFEFLVAFLSLCPQIFEVFVVCTFEVSLAKDGKSGTHKSRNRNSWRAWKCFSLFFKMTATHKMKIDWGKKET